MKHLFLLILTSISFTAIGQNNNILLSRDFWRSSPDVATIKAKIAEGHDPVQLTGSAFDAVTYAILDKAPYESIQYLLSIKGNEISKPTHDGRSYLMWAANAGNAKLTKNLIERGSDIHLVDDHGYTAFTFAATTGQKNTKVYDILIENGANINDTNRDGANSLLLIAAHVGDDFSMIEYFQKKGLAIGSTDKNGNGLFNYAARRGNIALMDKAISLNLPHKENNLNNGNAMIFASRGYRTQTNSLKVYKYLKSHGVKANVQNKNGDTPLHNLAYRTKDLAIFDFFIKEGVDLNLANKGGNTLLLNAVNGRNTDISLKYLPEVKDINHQNKAGQSALTFAVMRNYRLLFDKLLAAGADIKVVDTKDNNLAAYLFEAYRDGQEDDFNYMLQVFQQKKVSLEATQEKGNTLLHIAVDRHNEFLIEKALDLGVDLNAKNSDGLTAMHLAAMKAKNPKILTLLIKKGADKSIKTDFEETVYDLAAENELLKKAGFNLELLKK